MEDIQKKYAEAVEVYNNSPRVYESQKIDGEKSLADGIKGLRNQIKRLETLRGGYTAQSATVFQAQSSPADQRVTVKLSVNTITDRLRKVQQELTELNDHDNAFVIECAIQALGQTTSQN